MLVALLSPSRPKQRTQSLLVRLRTDNSPRLFQFGNRLSPLLSRLIMMTIWFFQVYGLQPILSHSSELRMVRPAPPSMSPVNAGTKANPKVLPISFALLRILVVAPMRSGHNSPVDWATTRGNDIGSWWGGLILPWQEGKSRVHISIRARLSSAGTTATL